MKIAGITGLLAVVTAVTGAAIPNVSAALDEVHQATGAVDGLLQGDAPSQEVTQLVNKLEKVEAALNKLQQNEKRGVASDATDVASGAADFAGQAVDGATAGLLKRDDAISGLAGQLLPSLTKQGILPEVTDLKQLTGLLNVLNVNGLLGNVEQVLGGLLNGLNLKGLTGDLLGGLLQRDDPISSLAGQLLPSLTSQGILPEVTNLTQLTGLLNVLNVNGLLGNVEQLLGGLLNGLPLKGLLKRDLLAEATDLPKELGLDLKRDDPISSLAGNLLPSLTSQGILPEVTNLTQLTNLLNVLNVNGLLGNVEQVLGGLLGGLPLKGLLGNVLKRDDAISSLAGQLLPSLTKQGILPEVTDLKQLTGLLNVLNVNGLLGNVEQLLGGLLNGLPLKGLL